MATGRRNREGMPRVRTAVLRPRREVEGGEHVAVLHRVREPGGFAPMCDDDKACDGVKTPEQEEDREREAWTAGVRS